MNLSQRLTELRKKSDLSQQDVAEKLDVTRQTASKWETGESVPTGEKLIQLSRLYGVTMDYLVNGGELPPKQPEPAPVEVPAEPAKPKKRTWKVVVAVVAALLLAALIYMGTAEKEKRQMTPMDTIKGEQVVIAPDNNFTLKD